MECILTPSGSSRQFLDQNLEAKSWPAVEPVAVDTGINVPCPTNDINALFLRAGNARSRRLLGPVEDPPVQDFATA